jgi:flavin-binding protein dodecin
MDAGVKRFRQNVIFGVGCAHRPNSVSPLKKEVPMPQSTYKVIELIGTSEKSWEEAAKIAVERAAEHLRELRVAEVVEQDIVITNGKVEAYRTKVKVSFKYEGHD